MASRSSKNTKSKSRSRTSAPKSRAAQRSDSRNDARMDIIGVLITALGIALLVAVTAVESGVITEMAAWLSFLIFGKGAYILPVALILWGLSFFLPKSESSEAKIALGLSFIFVSIISIIAVGMPFIDIFDAHEVVKFGGFVGSAVAWTFIKLTGYTISYILLSATTIIGLIITGLSVSQLVHRAIKWLEEHRPQSIFARSAGSRLERETRTRREEPRFRSTSKVRGEPKAVQQEFDVDPAFEKVTKDTPSKRELAAQDAKTVSVVGDAPTVAIKSTPPVLRPRKAEEFTLPSLSLLKKSSSMSAEGKKDEQRIAKETAEVILDTLNTFEVPSRVVDWVVGPTLTLFKIEIAKGVRLNKVTALENDLALALAASTLRILAPIPGESLVGIEVPNSMRSSVTLGDVMPPAGVGGPLEVAIGKDVSGKAVTMNLAKMPHLLIAGTTGSGKSVCVTSMLTTILMRATPAEVRLILIDPKRVEMSLFKDIPHLYVPVVTEAQEAAAALSWAVTEMERRLKIFSRVKVQDIGAYYQYLASEEASEKDEELPYLVIVIDELADLMMVAAKEVESSIVRIAQLARAAGIHLIVATQRPEAGIVTGLIKSNITHRIAFNVGSALDSRVILDEGGAEKLTGMGDMLYGTPTWPKPKRIQGAYVSAEEIKAVTDMLRAQKKPDYHEDILETSTQAGGPVGAGGSLADEYLWDAAELVVGSGIGSTSSIQRRFSVGYARAGRIMDTLTSLGIVGQPDGSKPREILVDFEGLDEIRRAALGLDEPEDDYEEEDFEWQD